MRRTRSTPLVRRIAKEHGVDISLIGGTGLSGRVTRADIMAYIESGAAVSGGGGAAIAVAPAAVATAPAPAAPASTPAPAIAFDPGEGTRVEPMTNMRKVIAEHMIASKRTSAHVHTVFEVDMTAVAAIRAKHKKTWAEREGVKLTYMPFILKAVIEALKAYPVVNASMDGENVIYHRSIGMGIAVALDWGLIVPVIKGADEKNLLGLARSVQDLAARARNRKLTPDEIQGSTFSVTNPGIFGGLYGTPIINQPNVAILGVGGIEKRPVVVNDAIAIRSMVYLVLGFDHRIIDGAVADQFMAHIKQTLERGTFTDLG
jgi:pyruvate dehydrogenase E2 component (dihydrolipoamide acetyltransferase)